MIQIMGQVGTTTVWVVVGWFMQAIHMLRHHPISICPAKERGISLDDEHIFDSSKKYG